MKIDKASAETSFTKMNISIPVENIDQENRIVSGWATIDNMDLHGDVVMAKASEEAFAEFRGNIREQHDPKKAIGKMVSFKVQDFYDQKSQVMHKGIRVDVRISKGAEDSWQKILDGTLSGFSIGAMADNKSIKKEYSSELKRVVQYIEKYRLTELSLVDSPGNQFCNVLSIKKSADQVNVDGIAVVEIKNVFYCEKDNTVAVSQNSEERCINCTDRMTELDWFEASENEVQQVQKILEDQGKVTEGGKSMAEEKENTPEVKEEVKTPENEEASEVTEETQEVDLSEVTKSIDDIKVSMQKFNEGEATFQKAVDEIKESHQSIKDSFTKEISELLEKHNALEEKITKALDVSSKIEERLDAVEGNTAIQKSNSVKTEELQSKKDKSVFAGSFLGLGADYDK